MSTDKVFHQLERLVGSAKSKEDYLRFFSRGNYSTKSSWPFASPSAGFYDTTNSSTNLILLNNRHKSSHLRGHLKTTESNVTSNDSYEYIAQKEIENRSGEIGKKPRVFSAQLIPNPDRHFEAQVKYWHSWSCKGSSIVDDIDESDIPLPMTSENRKQRSQTVGPARSSDNKSVRSTVQCRSTSTESSGRKNMNYDPAFSESLWQYYRFLLYKMSHPTTGLQKCHVSEPLSRPLRKSGIYCNPSLTHGQKLSLIEKCHVYDMTGTKLAHKNSYLQVLSSRFQAGLNDPRDFTKYNLYIRAGRPTVRTLNTGYLTNIKNRPQRTHRTTNSALEYLGIKTNERKFGSSQPRNDNLLMKKSKRISAEYMATEKQNPKYMRVTSSRSISVLPSSLSDHQQTSTTVSTKNDRTNLTLRERRHEHEKNSLPVSNGKNKIQIDNNDKQSTTSSSSVNGREQQYDYLLNRRTPYNSQKTESHDKDD